MIEYGQPELVYRSSTNAPKPKDRNWHYCFRSLFLPLLTHTHFAGSLSQVYDKEGHLVLYLKGAHATLGPSRNTSTPCSVVWQPHLTTEDASFQDCLGHVSYDSQPHAVAHSLKRVIESLRTASNPRFVFRILEVVEASNCSSVVGRGPVPA